MDLSTSYMGLHLRSPLVASASSLSRNLEGIRRLAGGGASAVVVHSLFEEELMESAERYAALAEAGSESFAESLSYFPEAPGSEPGPRPYLNLLERAARSLDVPVIASLNGTTPGGWTSYARQAQEAGAAAIELNLYSSPAGATTSGRDLEQRHVDVVRLVRSAVSVPVAVKMSAFYSSVGEMAGRFAEAGADGLVLFNRFFHPDIDPTAMAVVPGLGLSTPEEARLPRTWLALLRPHLELSLAASTGVETPEDLSKYVLAGADVVMTTSALLRHGPDYSQVLLEGLTEWMATKGFDNLARFRGLLAAAPEGDTTAGERQRYVTAMKAANASSAGPW